MGGTTIKEEPLPTIIAADSVRANDVNEAKFVGTWKPTSHSETQSRKDWKKPTTNSLKIKERLMDTNINNQLNLT